MKNLTPENILQVLKQENIRNILTRMMAHRFRTDILSNYYKFNNITQTISYHGIPVTPEELAKHEIGFLLKHADLPIDVASQKFWDAMSPNKNNNHLQDHLEFEDKYSEISALVSDMVLISPVFKLFANRKHLDVVDVGSGKGNLGRMIVAINEINQSAFNDTSDFAFINKVIHTIDVLSNVQVNFLNTDVYDWQDKENRLSQNKIKFEKQDSPFHIPAKDSSQDITITKWCFHHMSKSQMLAQTKNLYRVLKPGGISVVIEGFMTKQHSLPEYENDSSLTFKKQLWNTCNQLSYIDIWPEGPWKKECMQISEDYLNLPMEDQHRILSFEDFFGHRLLNKRETMPFPFTYIEAEELIKMFTQEGFTHEAHNFLLIGSAPIIRRGPFSARYIFRKPYPHEQ